MPQQSEVNQELEKIQQKVIESEKPVKQEHGAKKILRMVLMYGALALILAVVVMAFINRQ